MTREAVHGEIKVSRAPGRNVRFVMLKIEGAPEELNLFQSLKKFGLGDFLAADEEVSTEVLAKCKVSFFEFEAVVECWWCSAPAQKVVWVSSTNPQLEPPKGKRLPLCMTCYNDWRDEL